MRGSYYDVLGVSPTADEAEIRARYLLLMRRHHPDVNSSPMAHARATQIGEAFRALSDPTLRSRHDAELAQQRQEAVSARAILLYRNQTSRRLPGSRGRRLLGRSGARIALAVVLAGTLLGSWHLERRLTPGRDVALPPAHDDDASSEARLTIAALNAASMREARAMPAVSGNAVAGGVGAFRQLVATGKAAEARAYSELCHTGAVSSGTWDALDFCVAFDQAAFLADGKKLTAASGSYFVNRHDGAAHLYVSRISNMDAIAQRLRRIRNQVAPSRDERLQARTARALSRFVKRGWRIADAAREVFDPSRADHIDSAGKPRDF